MRGKIRQASYIRRLLNKKINKSRLERVPRRFLRVPVTLINTISVLFLYNVTELRTTEKTPEKSMLSLKYYHHSPI